MKPSNTGIDWLFQSINSPTLGAEVSMQLCTKDRALVCEWAAQIAIAEYRRELAAKVRKSERYHVDPDPVYPEPPHTIWKDTNGDYIRVEDVLSLLNENPNAE